jgi:hypothetical protein
LLVGVQKVTQGLFATEYLRSLLRKGCKIRKVYGVQEYVPAKCFKELAKTFSHRRSLESNPNATLEEKLKALTAKIQSTRTIIPPLNSSPKVSISAKNTMTPHLRMRHLSLKSVRKQST